MTARQDGARARRYLLGEASEEESAIIEREYFEHDEAVDRIAAAEDDLIEDYIAGELGPSERDRFERAYLSVPHRRVRVETMRRLMAHGSGVGSARPEKTAARPWLGHGAWLALAASLLVVASAALWRFIPAGTPETEVAESQAPSRAAEPERPSPATPAPSRQTFALTLSPAAVRSGEENLPVVIPAGTDAVVIRFESDVDDRKLVPRRASIQTVGGGELWQGPATVESNAPPGTAARIDVPAVDLPADDYVVTLYGTDRAGVEREWSRYFLRVRAR
jgi:hypothetical protein